MKAREDFKRINPAFVERYDEIDGSAEFYEYLCKPLRQSIRVNTLKGDYDEIVSLLQEKYRLEPISWCREGFFIDVEGDRAEGDETETAIATIGNTIEHQLGLIFSQEASSMLPPVVLSPKPEELVLDMAASPGAKTTQIAQYMENKGCIIANDVKWERINILISNIQRCGAANVVVTIRDGRSFKRFNSKFDRVLLDAPCSNVGMIRKNFKYLKIWNEREVYSLSRLQKGLIMAAYTALKPGGVLVYSTCTLEPEENEEVIDYLLSNTNARLEEIDVPLHSTKPLLEWRGKRYDREVRKCLRIHPQDNDSEAFFVAKVVKDED
jgi:NOL1/NOP2/sun family putative RNA methylase